MLSYFIDQEIVKLQSSRFIIIAETSERKITKYKNIMKLKMMSVENTNKTNEVKIHVQLLSPKLFCARNIS